jgi:hypothetical protein
MSEVDALEWYLILASSIFPLSLSFLLEQEVRHSLSFSFRGMKSCLRTTFDGLCSMDVYMYDQSTRVYDKS